MHMLLQRNDIRGGPNVALVHELCCTQSTLSRSCDVLKSRFSFFAVVALFATSTASAQSLLTSSNGVTQVTDFSAACVTGNANGHYCFGAGPKNVGKNGVIVTYTASKSSAAIGDGFYGLQGNGDWEGIFYAGTNSAADWVRFTFPTAVWSVGGIVNYSPTDGPPIIRAYDANSVLIASYDLSILAPIATAGTNQGAFRGIASNSANIASFEIVGAFLVTQDLRAVPGSTVTPEPSSLALSAAGLLALLAWHRRRRGTRESRT